MKPFWEDLPPGSGRYRVKWEGEFDVKEEVFLWDLRGYEWCKYDPLGPKNEANKPPFVWTVKADGDPECVSLASSSPWEIQYEAMEADA